MVFERNRAVRFSLKPCSVILGVFAPSDGLEVGLANTTRKHRRTHHRHRPHVHHAHGVQPSGQ